ncbi:MAG: DUF2207 domain-containing protein [Eubacteriales bacterium]|nr:DUF2207 domain-containing protein [Eubacteriales bacterium]
MLNQQNRPQLAVKTKPALIRKVKASAQFSRALLSLFACLIFCLTFFFNPQSVFATNSIDSIEIEVEILPNGDLEITQLWQTDSYDGTEFYIPFPNLNQMSIEDFTVSDERGVKYQTLANWDLNASFSEKAERCGILRTAEGLELCFGKTEYGPKIYTLNYRLTKAVQAFPDRDGFNLRLVNLNMEPAPEKLSCMIILPGTELSPENAAIWAFGCHGDFVFTDGIAQATVPDFNYDNHLTILFGLDKGLIQPEYQGQGSFAELRDLALIGSDYTDDGGPNDPAHNSAAVAEEDDSDYQSEVYLPDSGRAFSGPFFLTNLFAQFMPIFFIFLSIFGITAVKQKSKHRPKNAKEVDLGELEYYRDIPVDGHLPALYYFLNMRHRKGPEISNFISAYLLSCLQQGALEYQILNREQGLLFFKREVETPVFKICREPHFKSNFEAELWGFIRAAAGSNQLLEENELSNYFRRNQQQVRRCFEQLPIEGRDYALSRTWLNSQKKSFSLAYYLSPLGQRKLQEVHAFERFLKDFTLINEREPMEVEIWDKILIMATAYGLGEQVLAAFKKLSADYVFAENHNYYRGSNPNLLPFIVCNNFSNRAYNSSKSSSGSDGSRFSGGGGGISFGGGGGFSGGGVGGGSR